MNIKTLEVCSLVPAGEMAHKRWRDCTHTHTSHEYIKGRHNRYCNDCQVDLLPTENIGKRKQATKAMKIKYTNLKLKSNFNINRRDTFICWNCYNTYRNNAKNALTNSIYCPNCRDTVKNLQRENTHYDVIAVNDLGLQGLRENTLRTDLIANGTVFTQGFNQDDSIYSGLGRYTNSKPKKNTYQERLQITKAYNDINKYADGEYLKQPSKSWKKSDITEAKYIDEVLGFVEDEITIKFNNTEDNDDIYYDNNTD